MTSSIEEFKAPEWAVSPPSNRRHTTVIIRKNDKVIGHFQIGDKKCTIIGRNSDLCDVVASHGSISRIHAAFIHCNEGIKLMDLGSSHGTFLNCTRIDPNEGVLLELETCEILLGGSQREYTIVTNKRSIPSSSKLQRTKRRNKKKRKREEEDDERDDNDKHRVVHCLHLLIKHKYSRRPSSWKQKTIVRSIDDAKHLLRQYQEQLKKVDPLHLKEEFGKLARIQSDCSSAKRGGDLGTFGRGKMQPSFEKASFALKPGEMSDIVESKSGVHLIYRVE